MPHTSQYHIKEIDKRDREDNSKNIYSNIDLFNEIILKVLDKYKKAKAS